MTMVRAALLAIPLLLASVATTPTLAQGGKGQPAAADGGGNGCTQEQQDNARQRGRGIGGMLGGIARGLGGRIGGAAGMMTNLLPVDEMLGEAIAGMLDCREQQQAARATEEATRSATVGSTSTWQSESRPGVTGTSTVTAVENDSPQGDCVTVTDIVIVDGQETRAPKHMCRRPPSNRYVRV
jgi:surface antigen